MLSVSLLSKALYNSSGQVAALLDRTQHNSVAEQLVRVRMHFAWDQ